MLSKGARRHASDPDLEPEVILQIGIVYGNPEVTTGGNALKYWCSVRLEVRRIKTLEGSDGEQVGIKVRAKVGPFAPQHSSADGM